MKVSCCPNASQGSNSERSEQDDLCVYEHCRYCSAERFSLKLPPTKFTAVVGEEAQRNECKLWKNVLQQQEQRDAHEDGLCVKSKPYVRQKRKRCVLAETENIGLAKFGLKITPVRFTCIFVGGAE